MNTKWPAPKNNDIKRQRKWRKKKGDGFTIDKKATRHQGHKPTRAGVRNALGYDFLVKRERELALDLFGDDAEELPPPATTSTQPLPVKKVSNKKVKKARKKNVIPDDPFDIHGDASEPKRKPVWRDEDDENIKVQDVVATMTKARGSRGSRETSQHQYSTTLRNRFTQVIGGTPEWASLDHKAENDDENARMTRTTSDYLSKSSLGSLPKGRLEFSRELNLNHQSRTEGAIIRSVDFNPNLPVGLVAGFSSNNCPFGAVSLFKVDGLTNHNIQSVKFPSYPIRCAKFLSDGKKFVAGSNELPYFYVYDLEVGKETKVPCNLDREKWTAQNFYVSPNGEQMVFIGRPGIMYLYDTRTISHTATLYPPHQVISAAFNDNGTRMYTHGMGGDVCVWDMENRVCVHRFYDSGCIDGTSIAVSGCYLACGSSSGVVNVYDTSTLSSDTSPKPIKELNKMYTPVNTLEFNSNAEMLVATTRDTDSGIKLVHFPSMTYYSNFPLGLKGIMKPQSARFSPGGGYLAAGNNHGAAMLFRLHHYTSY